MKCSHMFSAYQVWYLEVRLLHVMYVKVLPLLNKIIHVLDFVVQFYEAGIVSPDLCMRQWYSESLGN